MPKRLRVTKFMMQRTHRADPRAKVHHLVRVYGWAPSLGSVLCWELGTCGRGTHHVAVALGRGASYGNSSRSTALGGGSAGLVGEAFKDEAAQLELTDESPEVTGKEPP